MNIFRRACSRIRDRERGRKSWYLSYDQFNEIKKGEGERSGYKGREMAGFYVCSPNKIPQLRGTKLFKADCSLKSFPPRGGGNRDEKGTKGASPFSSAK